MTMTREEAIRLLVEHDVGRWGEGERGASMRSHAGRSHGLAVNAVASRWIMSGDPDLEKRGKALAVAAGKLLTGADRAHLRSGG